MADGVKIGSIFYDLDIDDSGFLKATPRIKKELSGIEGAFKKAEAGSKAFMGAMTAVGAAGVAALGFGVKVAGDLESARQGFVALLGSADEADAVMARVKKEAAATPFELTGLVAGAQALTAVTKDGDKAIDTLLDVGKAIATSGKGQAELDRVIMNLQQIASTGKVTAMDIRQFQSAIPMFNDIIESAGLTQDELMNSSTAAEDLFEAFQKAGAEGGITASGFEAQAGTFNQLWSNLIDTVTIGMATFVETSGVFDGVKTALAGVIDTLNAFTTPEAIQNFVNFINDWGPVIAGIILGGITPALVAMTTALWGLMAPLLPFMAIGALLGLALKLLVDQFGGLDAIMKSLQPVFDIMVMTWQTLLLPMVQMLWTQIKDELLPTLQALWDLLSPVLIPVLKLLAIALGVIVLGAIVAFIGGLYAIVKVLTWVYKLVKWFIEGVIALFVWLYNKLVGNSIVPDLMNKIKEWFAKLPEMVKNALSNLAEVIMAPFKKAWEWIEPILNKIKDGLQKINPFHRESPSLVDNVKAGVSEIMEAYGQLGRLQVPSVNGMLDAMVPATVTKQDIQIYVDKVGDQQDINAIGRELGFRAGIMPR